MRKGRKPKNKPKKPKPFSRGYVVKGGENVLLARGACGVNNKCFINTFLSQL